MSQDISTARQTGISPPKYAGNGLYDPDLAMVERYLTVLEDNKKACHSDVTDADVAMDMAGFVRRQLHGRERFPRMSSALLALALVRAVPDAPAQ